MKRYFNILLLASAALALHSCIEDKGNYDYDDTADYMPAEVVAGLDDNYVVKGGDLLRIVPELKEGAVESDYDYTWMLTSDLTGLHTDTVGRTKNLDLAVNLRNGDYTLIFKIEQKATGTAKYYTRPLQTTTDLSQGWFVTKDAGNATDMDMIRADGTIVHNQLSGINGELMPGKPVKSVFAYGDYMMEVPGKTGLVNSSAYIVASETDVWVLSGDDMGLYKKTNSLFLEYPKVINPMDIAAYNVTGSMVVLINDGGFHWIPGRSFSSSGVGNSGTFDDNRASTVKINPNVCKVFAQLFHIAPGIMLIFDDKTDSFKKLTVNMFLTALNVVGLTGNSAVEGIPNCNEMDYDMVFMKEYNSVEGLGLMRSRSTGDYYGMRFGNITSSATDNPITAWVPVPSTAQVRTAPIRTVNQLNGTIYCSQGDNNVYAYSVGNHGDAAGSEENILSFAEGENVTYLADIRYQVADGGANFQYLVVLTSKGDNWNMYCYRFKGSSAAIESTPEQTYTGAGKAVHVFYRGLKPQSIY